MSSRRFTACAALVLAVAATPAGHEAARAQPGGLARPGSLPDDDFTWRWGEQRGNRIEDFSVRGFDTGFNCMLTGELSAGSRLSRTELRSIQTDLRSSMSFIAAATSAMNGLERQRDLDWAVLDCTKPDDDE